MTRSIADTGKGKKQFKRNKKEYDKLSDHIGSIPLVIISPADAILIQGGSEERRRFIDQVISQYDKNYLEALVTYQHALTQRNALLKNEQSADPELFDLWEEVLDRNARKIHRTREEFIAEFIPVFQHYYRQISGEAETTGLEYISHLQAETSLQELLRTNRDRDKLMGYTTKGIHKDELEMTLSSLPIRKIGSQGQNKTYLIALKLAQFDFLKRNSTRIPLLLLDDIFDKLDSLRVEEIIKLVGGEQFGQIFITDTDRNYLDEILARTPQNYRLFKVEAGEITPLDKA